LQSNVITAKQKKKRNKKTKDGAGVNKRGAADHSNRTAAAAEEVSNLFVPVARILQNKTFVSRKFSGHVAGPELLHLLPSNTTHEQANHSRS